MKKMAFLSLYRKYRPEGFQDLIGQDQVIRTLKNALKNDRVAHAYLFAGPRGTGKTSTAKVFARALNCSNPGPDFEPCGECNSCQRIANGNSLDVIEIDAASNRGIDEIRELREKVKFYPGEGKYKVYIIDEVHMLTKGAFNALLKTLEEPPASVVFILATTEPHKVLTTIMSRCQRFDFTLLSLNNLKARLAYISDAEGYQIEKPALDILARSARGGMRDAISLLDQAISFSDGDLTEKKVSQMLGRVAKDQLQQLLYCLNEQNTQQAIQLLEQLLESGLGIERLSEELIEYCRELLLIKECGLESGILEYSASQLEELAQAAGGLSTVRITEIIDEFAVLKQKLRSSARPRLQLELSVIKLSSNQPAENKFEQRLADLEYRLNSLLQDTTNLSALNEKSSLEDSAFEKKANSVKDSFADKLKSSQKISDQHSADKPEEEKSEHQSAAEVETEGQNQRKENKVEMPKHEQGAQSKLNSEQEAAVKVENKNNKDASINSSNSQSVLDLAQVKQIWGEVLNQVRQLDISVQALLREGDPAAVRGNIIFVLFPEDKKFHYKGACSNKALINKVLRNLLRQNVELELKIGELQESTADNSGKVPEQVPAESAGQKTSPKTNSAPRTSSKKEISQPDQKKIKQNSYTDNNKNTKNKSNQSGQNNDLDIETIARMFAGEIIEVDESILAKRGGIQNEHAENDETGSENAG